MHTDTAMCLAPTLLACSELAAALQGVDAVICCTGYTGINPSGFGQVDETVRARPLLRPRPMDRGRLGTAGGCRI